MCDWIRLFGMLRRGRCCGCGSGSFAEEDPVGAGLLLTDEQEHVGLRLEGDARVGQHEHREARAQHKPVTGRVSGVAVPLAAEERSNRGRGCQQTTLPSRRRQSA